MIANQLREFVDHILEQRRITDADVNRVSRELLADAVLTPDVIDVLIALDRSVETASVNWNEYLVTTVVDYVVWTTRPTGIVNRETAHWLVASLSVGEGPTANAMRIAFEVVREAERCDEMLIGFALNKDGPKTRQDLTRSDRVLLVA
jgi:hypothetical protein